MRDLFFILFTLFYFMTLSAQERFFPDKELMPVGAYYYPEHWDEGHWERDIKKIAELGFEFTHFAEFAWGKLEPEEGKYNFEWLDKCVSLAAANGLKIIMCTPTPTPPAWLTHKHPEILIVNEDGTKWQHGTRLHANQNHPLYRKYIEKMVKTMAKRYGNDERIWGWQIDNEPHFGNLYDYSDYALDGFRQWLHEKYGSIDRLNEAWGTSFWSQQYNHFDQIEIPSDIRGGSNPHAKLDFQRFTADALAASIRTQAEILNNTVSENQFVTTNYAYYKFLPSVDPFKNRDDLDFATHTMYLLSTFLNYPEGELAHRLGSGLELAFSNELARSVNGYTGIMELQPGQINWGKWNSQPLPGAVRMWIWHSFGLGDKFTCTYRFRQPVFGREQYHKGIMETDGTTLAPGGKEYVQALKEIKNLRKKYKPTAVPEEIKSRKTAFLWKQSNLLDLENTKHNQSWDTWQHYYTYYEGLKRLGCPITFITEEEEFDPKEHPFMVAPAYVLVNSKIISKWKTYVENGGHLILTTRTGMKNEYGHLWEARLQKPIWDLIGADIDFYDHMPPGKMSNVTMDGISYQWNIWGDILKPKTQTESWATHTDQFYKGETAVTHTKKGKGTVTYIGVWSEDKELEKQILQKVYSEAGAIVLNQKPYVFTEWRDGFWVTVNYTSEIVEAPLHEGSELIYGNKTLSPGEVVVWKK